MQQAHIYLLILKAVFEVFADEPIGSKRYRKYWAVWQDAKAKLIAHQPMYKGLSDFELMAIVKRIKSSPESEHTAKALAKRFERAKKGA